ncbi:MAG: hypothetical protein WED09_05395 [Homoserinimonas sp.]
MSMAGNLISAALGLIVFAGGGVAFVGVAESAQVTKAAETIASLEGGQVFAGADADRSAASIEDLTAVLAQAPRPGTTLSYVVSAEGSDYVLAAALPSGGILFGSATHARGDYIKCEAYTAECISKVTGDPTLIAAAPIWVTF